MKTLSAIVYFNLFVVIQITAQDLTQNYRKLILNSSNDVSLFQSNSTNGVWASGIIASDRWGIFEDATTTKERFTILSGGNIGIGTTTPDSKLTVKGHVNIGGDGNYHLKTRHIDGKSFENTSIDNLYFNYGVGKKVYVGAFYTGSLPTDLLVSGNLGIGTTSPNAKLEVKDETDNQLSLVNNTGNQWQFRAGSSGSLIFKDDNVERIRIDQLGNLGIGTSAPDSKLTVKGNIHSNEVKVDLLGAIAPDYVFYKDYDLKTLQEVEAYILDNGHLANIPSAEEMEEDGISLKEMNLKLLEKIEELTLYTIAQEKELNNQKNINKSLEEKLSIQDTRLKKIEIVLNSLKQ